MSGICDWDCWYVCPISHSDDFLSFYVLLYAYLLCRGLCQRQGLMDCSRVVFAEHSSPFPDPCCTPDRSFSWIYPHRRYHVPGTPSAVAPPHCAMSNGWSCALFASAGPMSCRIASTRRRPLKSSSARFRHDLISIIRMHWIWNCLLQYVFSASIPKVWISFLKLS